MVKDDDPPNTFYTRQDNTSPFFVAWTMPIGTKSIHTHADLTTFPAIGMFGDIANAWQVMIDISDNKANEEGDPMVVIIDHELWTSTEDHERKRLSEWLSELVILNKEEALKLKTDDKKGGDKKIDESSGSSDDS